MQCKCSLNNNYQVIGLCDIEEFNQKINEFMDKSWTQIIIPEKLILPENYPSLKSISKIYLDIKITSTKIINTPNSYTPNVAGLILTGKALLVSGTLCQSIIYTSDSYSQTMHSVKFNFDFNTHIVIDKDADIDNDKYCIYPCVEDISVRTLNKRTLSKNVTLFLFAHKIITPAPPPPPTINITNKFIFKSHFDNTDISRVEFDSSNKKLIVTSTGTPYDVSGSTTPAFIFLVTANGQTFKASGIIKSNEDADKFKSDLNDKNFEIDDLIVLRFLNKSKLYLTDYPQQGEIYQMIAKNGTTNGEGQSFKITQNGIFPNTLTNSVILNSDNNNPSITVQFDILFEKILCKAQGYVAGTNFTMTLYHSDGTSRKRTYTINQFNTGSSFANTFNNFPFQWNDIIELNYADSTKVVVTNLPPLTGTSKRFKITKTGLVDA